MQPAGTIVAQCKSADQAKAVITFMDAASEAVALMHAIEGDKGAVQPAGTIVAQCKSADQAKAVITFMDAASEKLLRSTVALTAARCWFQQSFLH